VGRAVSLAKESLRVDGGLPLLIGGVLTLVSLPLPWGEESNSFEYLRALAVLWVAAALWSAGLALVLTRIEDQGAFRGLAILASVALLASLFVVLDSIAGGWDVGGGPSLASVGLVLTLVGVAQTRRRIGSSDERASRR
jgi:low temperature requirement protein LtrA